MLPDQQFDGIPSGNPMPPWTPEVWAAGPDALVAKAQAALWQDTGDVHSALAGGKSSMAMAGDSQPENESDQLINGSTPGDSPSPSSPGASRAGGRATQWKSMLGDLRQTEPLASWSSGQKDGPPDPPA